MLAEQVVLYEDGVIAVPEGLSFEQAACLPCAGVTAWHALMHAGRPTRAGDTVLVLGTGGVSMLALQFAKAAGARVIATSSSDEKLAKALALGASDGINYKRSPDWDQDVMKVTDGRGVDCVVEVGGAGTLNRSFQSLAFGGKVVLIGLLTGRGGGDVNPYTLMPKWGSLHGIFVGNREMFESMNKAIVAGRIQPVVGKEFPFADALQAYRCQASGDFFSKVVITLPSCVASGFSRTLPSAAQARAGAVAAFRDRSALAGERDADVTAVLELEREDGTDEIDGFPGGHEVDGAGQRPLAGNRQA